MTTTKTTEAPPPQPLRTVAVRADATSVHGLAASSEEARRWLHAVSAHGHRTALARIVIAASTPAPNSVAANPETVISAVGDDPWEHVDDWTVAGERGDDPRRNNPLPAATRTAIIDGAGNLQELAANPETSRDSPSAFLEYLAELPTIDKQPLAVIHASRPDRPWIGIQRRRVKVLQLPDDA